MPEKAKKLCKWKPEDIEKINIYSEIVKNPGFLCAKCGRAAYEAKGL